MGIKTMKTKKKIVLLVCIAVFVGLVIFAVLYWGEKFGIGMLSTQKKVQYAQNEQVGELKADWRGDWIWCADSHEAQWVIFKKDIECTEASSGYMDIATDTYYWLWVNEELVVFEGCSKRGATPTDGYYDHIELDCFDKGLNTITILVHYLGDDGYSHIDSGHGGLRLDGAVGDTLFESDESFLAKEYLAYQYHVYDSVDNVNYRLSEKASNIYGEYLEDFVTPSSALCGYPSAVPLSEQEAEMLGKSYLNILPPKKFGEIIEFANYDNVKGISVQKTTNLVLDLPKNVQFTPCFEFYCEEAVNIKYYVNNADRSNTYPLKSNYVNTLHSAKGENCFEDYCWQNGEHLIVELPKGVTLLFAGYRISAYNCENVEDAFWSDDAFINTLWEKALNTLNVTMRDTFMDCPDRERAQWIGDAVIETEMSYYALSPSSSLLFRKAILTLYGWQHSDGVFQTVVPDGVEAYELPQQNLAAIVAFENYLTYTGDYSVFEQIYTLTFDYLRLYEMEAGLVVHRAGSWDWGDWGSDVDSAVLENAWYYYATTCAKRLAVYADNKDDIAFCEERLSAIESAFDKEYWHEDGYRSGKKPDDRANALAVISGLASEDKYPTIVKVLTEVYNSSPYMEYYVETALCMTDNADLALERAKRVYSEMVNDSGSTLWELWDKNAGTVNHAWSGGIIVILGKYIAGLRPTGTNYSSFVVEPQTDVLDNYSVKVNPRDGQFITVDFSTNDNEKLIELFSDLPNGTILLHFDGTVKLNGEVLSGNNGEYSIPIIEGELLSVALID